ncbi:MAG TPA: SMC-Scp complex subunit ScpB [Candidatus Paceibacterota bacterium]
MDLAKQIEAVLFFKGEPVKISDLAKMFGIHENEISEGLVSLEAKLKERGVCLMRNGDAVMLATAPETSPLIEKLQKEELSRELGKAATETLAIVLYRGPVTRADIDYMRGVNSTFILRSLLVRGLLERAQNPADQRGFIYKPSFELLSFLGITKSEELPDFAQAKEEMELFIAHTEGGAVEHGGEESSNAA